MKNIAGKASMLLVREDKNVMREHRILSSKLAGTKPITFFW